MKTTSESERLKSVGFSCFSVFELESLDWLEIFPQGVGTLFHYREPKGDPISKDDPLPITLIVLFVIADLSFFRGRRANWQM